MEDNIFDKVHEVDLQKTMKILYRLCHECNRLTSAAGCPGRTETGTETSSVFNDRAEQWS